MLVEYARLEAEQKVNGKCIADAKNMFWWSANNVDQFPLLLLKIQFGPLNLAWQFQWLQPNTSSNKPLFNN